MIFLLKHHRVNTEDISMKPIELLTRFLLLFLLVLSIALVCGCSHTIKDSKVTNPPTTFNKIFGPVSVESSVLSIHLYGPADLPDGTILQTQLYLNNQSQIWWPANQNIQVQNGGWEITVRANENGTPKKLPSIEDGDSIRVWERDNPTIMIDWTFFFPGPPPS